MWNGTYWAGRYWGARYWGRGGSAAPGAGGGYWAPSYFASGFYAPGYWPGLTPATPLPTNAPLAYVQDRSFLDTCDLYRLVVGVDSGTNEGNAPRYVPAATGVRCLIHTKPVEDEPRDVGRMRIFSRRVAPELTLAFGQEIDAGWRVKRTTPGQPTAWFQVLGEPARSPFPGRPGYGDIRCEMQPDPHAEPVS